MAIETKQSFLKGINKRFPRDESTDPDFFWETQNARILQRGETGKVVRINGFSKFNSPATDYTNILDIINFRDKFVVFYEDSVTSGTFHLDVYSQDGTRDFTDSYTDTSVSKGKLTQSESTIFIAPHNKVLYYDGTSWTLADFIPNVPDVTAAVTGSGNQASGSIEPTSGPSTTSGEKAKGHIRVHVNNIPVDTSETFEVKILDSGGSTIETSSGIVANYDDTENAIARKIYNACTGFTNYDVSMSKTEPSTENNGTTIYFTATSVGFSQDTFTTTSNFNVASLEGDGFVEVYSPTLGRTVEVPFEAVGSPEGETVVTLGFIHPKGTGLDGETSDFGPLHIYIPSGNVITSTVNILATDTATDIADKIENALEANDIFTSQFDADPTIPRTGDVLTIQALDDGKKYNGPINLRFEDDSGTMYSASDVFSYNVSALSGGDIARTDVSLEQDTDYWYTVRYRYIDGYITPTANPKLINTGPSQAVQITVDTGETDLDGQKPKLQIFRRKEGEDFFLIDEVRPDSDPYTYTDIGESKKDRLNEKINVFTKSHKTQEILENRLVQGNIEYFDESYSNGSFSLATATSTNEKVLPEQTKALIYYRPTYTDGSKGYFSKAGEIEITDSSSKLEVTQSATVTPTDKTIEELGFFANYIPTSEEFTVSFNSPELTNKNIPTVADRKFFPSRTRVFFGFKYLEVISTGSGHAPFFKVYGWEGQGNTTQLEHGGIVFGGELEGSGANAITGAFPREFTARIFGLDFKYVRIAIKDNVSGNDHAVYKLDIYDALAKAVETGKLRLRLTSSTAPNLSSTRSQEELFDREVKITGLIDMSTTYQELRVLSLDEPKLVGPFDTRLYFELEESPLDDIDNRAVTRYNLKRNYRFEGIPEIISGDPGGIPTKFFDTSQFSLSFELINFKLVSSNTYTSSTASDAQNDGGIPLQKGFQTTITDYRNQWDYSNYSLVDLDLLDSETAIYIGSKENTNNTTTFDYTGYEVKKNSSLYISRLEKSNIYNSLVLDKDIVGDTDFKNQLIWSDPIIIGSQFSGGREFKLENFLNISSENGNIVDIRSLDGNLYVFCERGVAVVFVGEVLTSQKSGEIFIDSSGFLTNYKWINTDLNVIDRDTIVKRKNQIFFTDGFDVYRIYSQGIENITNGILDIDPASTFSATWEEEFSEYKLSDLTNNETWVFNAEFGQWYGPFTYITKHAADYNTKTVSNNGTDLVEHNIGNTFNSNSFTTSIKSVASDRNESFFDKNFRKFYIQTTNDTNAVFKYGKNSSSLQSKNISSMVSKNGYYHQGIIPTESNSKVIFWELESTDNNFELNDISWRFNIKRRR